MRWTAEKGKPALLVQWREANFFQKLSEAWVVGPQRLNASSGPDVTHASVALLISKFEGSEGMILLTQTGINICDSQPGNVFRFRLFDQLAENFSCFFGLSVLG